MEELCENSGHNSRQLRIVFGVTHHIRRLIHNDRVQYYSRSNIKSLAKHYRSIRIVINVPTLPQITQIKFFHLLDRPRRVPQHDFVSKLGTVVMLISESDVETRGFQFQGGQIVKRRQMCISHISPTTN